MNRIVWGLIVVMVITAVWAEGLMRTDNGRRRAWLIWACVALACSALVAAVVAVLEESA